MPWSCGGILGGRVRGMPTLHVCGWGLGEGVRGVSHKTFDTVGELPGMSIGMAREVCQAHARYACFGGLQ
jgi:hypothetical protein